MIRRRLLPLLGGLLAVVPAVSAQPADAEGPAPGPAWRLYVNGSLGLARRQNQPWVDIHTALEPSGWDDYFPIGRCVFYCPRASDVAEGFPPAFTAAVRWRLTPRVQLRAFAATAALGRYPGRLDGIQLRVLPAVRVAGAQALVVWRAFWIGGGPTLNVGRVVERTDNARQEARGTSVGAALGLGMTFPRRGPVFVELSLERRIAGSLPLPLLVVPGASQPVPAMRVKLSHTLLAVGVGLRR